MLNVSFERYTAVYFFSSDELWFTKVMGVVFAKGKLCTWFDNAGDVCIKILEGM